jgi:methylenetetrahydrofolate dehydrogenase (NADP+)/methenyltetrahydrofolate cyclohydrolase
MTATILDGTAVSKRLMAALTERVAAMARKPTLAVVLVGQDPASQVYVKRKGKVAHEVGLGHRQIDLPVDTTEADLLKVVAELAADDDVDGILVQFPVPPQIRQSAVLDAIPAEKDVDGLTTANLGRLVQGRPLLVACTPKGAMRLIAESGVDPAGKRAVVIGRSNIVGRPMALLLEQANATVTVAHSRTPNLADVVREADLVVAAVGRPEFVKASWVKPGAVVIDVGINRTAEGKLVGDVATAEVAEVAGAITPVPGGVGPMTIAMLMENTVEAAVSRRP